jgi:two-component system response regulator NreC
MSLARRALNLGVLCECTLVRQTLGRALRNEDWIEQVVELEDYRVAVAASAGPTMDILIFAASVTHHHACTLKLVQGLTPRPKLLLLLLDDDDALALQALRAGALGVLSKRSQLDELFRAIRLVHSGQRYLSGPIQRTFSDRYLSSGLLGCEEHLTKRENEVLRLLALGANHHEISRQLFVSVKTIDTHRSNILRKLRLRNNADIARYAIRSGLIDANEANQEN